MKSRGKKTLALLMVMAILFTISLGAWGITRGIKAKNFETVCTQYISRAKGAASPEIAKEELTKVISYLEENNLTDGCVSIFWKQPRNNIGFWYKNLKEAYTKLDSISENASNVEIRMRMEEFRDSKIGAPEGISIYPQNAVYFWWSILSLILCLGFWIATLIFYNSDYYWP